MKTLYVHIGTPKTGTTAIQCFCDENRELLEKNGYCYPDFPYVYKGKSRRRNGLFLTAKYYDKTGQWQREEEKRIFAEGMTTISKLFEKFDHIILSDEGIWFAARKRRKEIWQELKEQAEKNGFEVRIIVYLRRQDEQTISNWNQKVKHGMTGEDTMTWEQYLTDQSRYVNLEYYKSLQRIAKVIGSENMTVRRFDRNYFTKGMIQADFLETIGLELTEEYILDTELRNTKLSLNGCEIKRVINEIPDITTQQKAYFEGVLKRDHAISEKEYSCDVFSMQERKEFLEQYREDNEKIVKCFIGDDHPLFHDNIKNVVKWEKENPYMIDDVIRMAASSDLNILKKLEEQNQIIKEQNVRIASLTKEVNALVKFREKMKHPVRTIFRKLFHKK